MATADRLVPDRTVNPTAETPDSISTLAVWEWIADSDRLVERAARTHLWLLASAVDSLVSTAHDESTALSVRDRARALLPDEDSRPPSVEERDRFAKELVDEGINPGTTADLLAAGLFVALERDGVTL